MNIDFQIGQQPSERTVTTVGSFDGVHVGHQHIVQRMHYEAKLRGLKTLVASFHPHPREVLSGECTHLLTPVQERTSLLRELQLDYHALIPFDQAFSLMEPEEFVESVLVATFKIQVVIVGYDHRFGKDRRGDLTLLKQMGTRHDFEVIECAEIGLEGHTVSSSTIRKFIGHGKVASAKHLLGRFYDVCGTVVHGAGRGKKLGIPTANLSVHPAEKLVPGSGVYAVKAEIVESGLRFGGMMNIGRRPTFEGKEDVTVEVHLFDFNDDLYDREVRVEFVERIRDERKFASVSLLIEQLNEDRLRCIGLLGEIS